MMLYEVYFRTPSLHRKPVEVQGCEEGCVPSGGLRPQDCAEDCALGEFYGRMGAADTHAHAHAHGHAHGHAHAGANGGGASGGNGGRRVGGSKTLGAIQAYVGHDVFLASLSFCLLFMTVLDNGTLITSYFTWRDIHASVLGLQRGVGAACGLAGTFAFMALLSWGMDEKRVGLFSIWFFAACMVPPVVMLGVVGESRVTDYALIAGMVFSRAALWMFDLAEKQIMQTEIEESKVSKRACVRACACVCARCVSVRCVLCWPPPAILSD